MCGIAGIFNLSAEAPPTEHCMRRMLGMIRHRGPDQFGIYLDKRVALGNARLSILDLESGQQPISNEDDSLWIVFNGEIFNYVELRSALQARGHRFKTHSDTEVFLHLYEDEGPDCLNKLNGQFAVAIWDRHEQTLFLARDRLGIRPLFYTQTAGTLIFGSEVKALLADPRVVAQLDPVVLDQIFTFWCPASPHTIFRNILQLPAGHFMLAKGQQCVIKPYWQLEFPSDGGDAVVSKKMQMDYEEEFHALLVDATKIRLRADVPVGAYLSGGLDSSTIATIIKRYTANHLDTFSISFNDADFDESPYQKRMADYLGTDHHVVYATHADIGRVFADVIWHTETPIMRTAPAPMFLLSRLVREQGYKVVLTGEGADEFLAGYDIFKEAKIRRFWARQPASTWRPLLFKRLYADISGLSKTSDAFLSAFFKEGLTDTHMPDYSHLVRWRNNRRTTRFFSPDVMAAINHKGHAGLSCPAWPAGFDTWQPLSRAQFLEITFFLSQYLLSSQGDRVAMAHSVEGRFPFLDWRVVEFCNRLPGNLKLRGLTEKFLLKQLSQRWLPGEITQRVKRPYRAPVHRSFFNATTADFFKEHLDTASIRNAGLFNPAMVSRLIHKVETGRPLGETEDMALAGIVSTQLVYHRFVANFEAARPLSEADDVKVCNATAFNR